MHTDKLAVLFLSDSGGVGKTTMGSIIFDVLRGRGVVVSPWDLDAGTGAFARYDSAVQRENLLALEGGSSRYIADLYGDAQVVLADAQGGHVADLSALSLDGSYASFAEMVVDAGRRLVLVVPIGTMASKVTPAQTVMQHFPSAEIVIILNGFFGAESDFVIFNGDGFGNYGATGRMARERGATVKYIPRINPRALAVLDQAKITLLAAARNDIGEKSISGEIRFGAKNYLKMVEKILAGTPLDVAAAGAQ